MHIHRIETVLESTIDVPLNPFPHLPALGSSWTCVQISQIRDHNIRRSNRIAPADNPHPQSLTVQSHADCKYCLAWNHSEAYSAMLTSEASEYYRSPQEKIM